MKVVNGVEVITLEVDVQAWNVIQAGLQELPMKLAAPILQKLSMQIMQQAAPVKAPEAPALPEVPAA